MIFSDRTIKEYIDSGNIVITPFSALQVQPSSYDVRLGNKILLFEHTSQPFIDLKRPVEERSGITRKLEISEDKPLILHPGEFILASTKERVAIPDNVVAQIEGKSSLARLGILIHSTAGYIDPGWDGHITLEMSNVSNIPVTLYANMPIGQLVFIKMTTPADIPYGNSSVGSKYHGSDGPVESKYRLM